MIPGRIRLHNFLSYKDCEVDFSGLHLAVLSGKNGDGKSALLDAMTWAVWGDARGNREDERIHGDEPTMSVDFEFEVDGDRFAVVRKRTRGKSTGELHFFQIQDGYRIPKTGGTISETGKAILAVVRMDYDTFLNSAFIAQGRSNEFTKKRPAERKELFRKLLDLERYETYSKRARERALDAKMNVELIDRAIAEARDEVAQLPEIEERIREGEEAACALKPQIAALESSAAELRAAAANQERIERAAAEADERLQRARDDFAARSAELDALKAALEAAEATLARSADIEARYATLVQLRRDESALATLQAQARDLEKQADAAHRTIHGEEQRLRTLIDSLCEEVGRLRKLAERLPELEHEPETAAAERAKLEDARAAVITFREGASAHRAAAAGAGAKVEELKTRGSDLQERKKQLQRATALCPVCGEKLGPEKAERLIAETSTLIAETRDGFEAAKRAVADAEAAAAAADTSAAQTEKLADQLQQQIDRGERERLTALSAARDAVNRAVELEGEAATHRATLESGAFASEAREALREAEAAIAVLGYDSARHAAIREESAALAGVDEEHLSLEGARTKREMLTAQIDTGAAAIERATAGLAELETAAAKCHAEVDGLDDARPRLADADEQLQRLRDTEAGLQRDLGQLSATKERIAGQAIRLEEESDRRKGLAEEQGVFDDLHRAFGRDGVQALLIEQSLPRVEQTANAMLQRMTGGRIEVGLRTLKENASGTLKDTLAIQISDELGTRDYEMYSGGEAFRVDFALRIALAKLLAERSGATLPTLIIDEGFGTQDQEGIDRLVETLSVIQDEFQLILVVTHLDELKARFDRRIEVTKDASHGSMARVV